MTAKSPDVSDSNLQWHKNNPRIHLYGLPAQS